jgi:hypothetical protein
MPITPIVKTPSVPPAAQASPEEGVRERRLKSNPERRERNRRRPQPQPQPQSGPAPESEPEGHIDYRA